MLNYFGTCPVYTLPFIVPNPRSRGWVGMLQRKDDAVVNAAAQRLNGMRPTAFASRDINDHIKALEYLAVVAELFGIDGGRHTHMDATPFQWQILRPRSLLTFENTDIIHCHVLREEFMIALYNFAAACLQSVAVLYERIENDEQQITTSIRLTTCAQNALVVLYRKSLHSDRVASGAVSIDYMGDMPLPVVLSRDALDLAIVLTHGSLTQLHATHLARQKTRAADVQIAGNYAHMHVIYNNGYSAMLSCKNVPRLSVVPGLAERQIAVNRNLALAIAYMEAISAQQDTSEDIINALSVLGQRAITEATKSLNKTRQLIKGTTDADTLLNDPYLYAREQTLVILKAVGDDLKHSAMENAQTTPESEAAASALLLDDPSFSDIPGGESGWADLNLEQTIIDKATKCIVLLRGDDNAVSAKLSLISSTLAKAIFGRAETGRFPLQTRGAVNAAPISVLDTIAQLPAHQQPYGTLILAIRRFTHLRRMHDAFKEKNSNDIRQASRARRSASQSSFHCIHRMLSVLFLRHDTAPTYSGRVTKERYDQEKALFQLLGASTQINQFDAMIASFNKDSLTKDPANLPLANAPAYAILLNCLAQLKEILAD